MKRKAIFLMACALMIVGISLIVNSTFGIFKRVGKNDDTTVTEQSQTDVSPANTTPLGRALFYIKANTEALAPGSIGGDYTAIILALTEPDSELLDTYRENAAAYVNEKGGVLHSSRYTEYSRITIGIASVGLDPRDVGGFDIAAPLLNHEKVTNQGINGCAWALMALDCGVDEPEGTDTVRDSYISLILSAQNEDGSFGALKYSEVDMTAMCLRSLARHTDRADVADACTRGVAYLAWAQGESGGFPSPYGESSEPVSQSILALCALGLTDTEQLASLTETLLTYQNEDGGFAHNIGGASDRLATEQAVQALIAVERAADGKPHLFDF